MYVYWGTLTKQVKRKCPCIVSFLRECLVHRESIASLYGKVVKNLGLISFRLGLVTRACDGSSVHYHNKNKHK
jgi:hypothetical protein